MEFKPFTFSEGIDISLAETGRPMPAKNVLLHCWVSHFSFHWDTVFATSVLDIAAGDGLFSLLATKCCIQSEVHAFEVSSREFKLLERNRELNESWFNDSSLCLHNHLPDKKLFNRTHLKKPLSVVRIATNYGDIRILNHIKDLLEEFFPTCFIQINSLSEYALVKEFMDELGYNSISQIHNENRTPFDSWYIGLQDQTPTITEGNNMFVFKRI